jgi:phospholipase A1
MNFDLLDANYFLTGSDIRTPSNGDPSKYSEQIKFRVAIRYRVVGGADRNNLTGVYATYVQNSLWNLYWPSGPFYDNNYQPGILAIGQIRHGNTRLPRISGQIGYVHESNGRDASASRGWDRLQFGVLVGRQGDSWGFVDLKFWSVFRPDSLNLDIRRFAGNGELKTGVQFDAFPDGPWKVPLLSRIDLRARIHTLTAWPSREVNVVLHLPWATKLANPQLHLQLFDGTSESLLDYRRATSAFRIGFSLMK